MNQIKIQIKTKRPDVVIRNKLLKTGMRHTEESKKKMSLALKGRVITDETKKLMSLNSAHYWLGKKNPMFGKHHSEETKRKIGLKSKGRKTRLGCKLTEKTKDLIRRKAIGRRASEETRKKISLKGKGRLAWNAGIKNCFNEETLGKMSIAGSGRKHTVETRMKMSVAQSGKNHPFFGKHLSLEHKKKLSDVLKGRKPKSVFKNSMPEKMMQVSLGLEGISFRTHVDLDGTPDIFVEPCTCIFIDGVYWHIRQDRRKYDTVINNKLIKKGFNVIRILAPSKVKHFDVKKYAEQVKSLLEIDFNGIIKLGF